MTWSSPISWLADRNIRGTVPLGGEVWWVWGSESLIQNSMFCLKLRICYNQRWLDTLKRGLRPSLIDTHSMDMFRGTHVFPNVLDAFIALKFGRGVKLSRSREEEYSFGSFLFYFWIFWRLARGVILGRVLCCWMSPSPFFFFFFLKKLKLYMVISHGANLLFEFKFLNITIWLFFFFCDFFSNIYIYIFYDLR